MRTSFVASLLIASAWACSSHTPPLSEPRTAEARSAHVGKAPAVAAAKTATSAATSAPVAGDPDPDAADPSLAPAIVGDRDASPEDAADYASVVKKVTGMVRDPEVTAGASRRGLSVLDLAWEDTGRAEGSSLGPNISDLTLQVRYPRANGRGEQTALMPVIRFPNFTDRTGDVPKNRFFVRTGNHKDPDKLGTAALSDVLRNLRGHLSKPGSMKGSGSFLAGRDSHFLVSAQAVFLPIPAKGKATFNPVVFNYQSAPKSPAVLTLLATRQGTSVSIIENRPEDQGVAGWGQELYFNAAGKRSAFTAERREEVVARIEAQGGPKNDDEKSAIARGADVLFLVQVPLVHKQRGVLGGLPSGGTGSMWGSGIGYGFGAGGLGLSGVGEGGGGAAKAPTVRMGSAGVSGAARPRSDVDRAVLGHGDALGPFLEGGGLKLERDARFPIRITVQFYKATSNGVVSEADLDAISRSIGSVYEHADAVGSLVLPDDDAKRPTAWQSVPGEWFPW